MPIHGYPGNVITANPTAPTVSAASGVWTTEQQLQAVSQGNWPGYEYPISRSLRFNSADSAYLNRTPASAGNRKTWTWSGWIKRSALASVQTIFSGGDTTSNNDAWLRFDSGDTISFQNLSGGSYTAQVTTSAVFRDPSAWYHIVLTIDTTQATGSDRVKIYVNGVQQTVTFTTTPSQNADMSINIAGLHTLGRLNYSAIQYLNGYLTEINFIDGQALTPSSFGLNDPETGIWSPKQYTGTYGTNGFYLNFSDNSNTTSTTLGKDTSGNGNNWTPNNFSVTAGAGNDSMVDSPTSYGTDTGVGGEVRGNYATLNPLDKNSGITLTNGNLDASMPTQLQNVYGTVSVTSGKWYWETTINSMSGRLVIGVGNTVDQNWNLDPSSSSALWGYYSVNGNKLNGSNTAYGNSYTANDVVGVAVDMDSGKIWFSKNGTWQASGDPAAGTNAAFTNLTGSVRPMYDQQLTNAVTISTNFGQRPFAYTAPSGFKALCTQNLPPVTIGATSTTQANKYMDVTTYTGTGVARSITNSGSMQPDFVWIKDRTNANDHALFDAVRGATIGLRSNLTNAEVTDAQSLTAFNSNGFSLGTSGSTFTTNFNGSAFVGWQWNAGGSTVTNTSGTISSQVRANTTSGFSIVTFNIPASGTSDTIGHGLGVAPSMVILKPRTAGTSWGVYHSGLTSAAYYLTLQTTNAQALSNNWWNSTAPTSSVFTIGSTWYGTTNAVAYCFAAVPGYSFFGTFTGNGSGDGPFVYCGFRPRYLMIKRYDASGDPWWVIDSARSPYNQTTLALRPNSSNAEDNGGNANFDFLSNGFKARTSGGGNGNESGATYIIAAFAESPFKYSLAR